MAEAHNPPATVWCSLVRMANDFEKQTKGFTEYLRRHSIHIDADDPWPGDNWYEWEKIQEKLDTKRSLKDKKGKGIICHALGLCLKAA